MNGFKTLAVVVGLLASFGLARAQSLGTASSFCVLGGSTVTNTGPSTFVGDIGVSPGISITGIPGGQPTGGSIHLNDALAISAHADLATAFAALAAMPCVPANNLTGLDLGGMTLTPGVYCFNTSAGLTGTLTFDALGNPAAVFVIQTGSTFITAANASVVVINGASPSKIFWKVGSSATLATNSVVLGNICAAASITLVTGASCTKALAVDGAVTCDTNDVGGGLTPTSQTSWGRVKMLYR